MIDSEGFRENVGIILCNGDNRLLWAKRIRQRSWQFPQGGIQEGESHQEAMYRELAEEVGLTSAQVRVLGHTRNWLYYRLPKRLVRKHSQPTCVGQKQIWYLLRIACDDTDVCLDACERPEFDAWCWVNYWLPPKRVVYFKREVYRTALTELAPLLFSRRARLRTSAGRAQMASQSPR